MEFTFLQLLWYFLIFLLIAGYFVLDGFDQGIGVLYPALAKNEKERAMARQAIGPVWDGNEVWLLTAGGGLFAAFAPAYATTFSGFYLAIMLVLFGLILRAAAIELRAKDNKWAKIWDGCFCVGSLLPALLTGVAVGNIYAGIPMAANGDYCGIPLLGLVTPFTLLCGLLGLSMMLTAGCAWLALKTPLDSEIRARAKKFRQTLAIVTIVLFLLVTVYALLIVQPAMVPALAVCRILFAVITVGCMIAVLLLGKNDDKDLIVFLLQSLAAFAIVFLLAFSMFPNLVVAAAGSAGPTIGIANAASSEVALTAMTVIACIGVPLVLLYHVIVYRTFRGRLTADQLEY